MPTQTPKQTATIEAQRENAMPATRAPGETATVGPEQALAVAERARGAFGASAMLALQNAAGNRAVVGLGQMKAGPSATAGAQAMGNRAALAGIARKAAGGVIDRGLPSDGGGRPMPEDVQAQMSAALGMDLSSVRIYEGPAAHALGARAFTKGLEAHFAPGEYQPRSPSGLALLGHEMAHVVQQSQGRVRATAHTRVGAINDDAGLEQEADELAARTTRGQTTGAPAAAMGAPDDIDIHLGPGQDQVRAAATVQAAGGFGINDDAGLERETDEMDARALVPSERAAAAPTARAAAPSGVAQFAPLGDIDHIRSSCYVAVLINAFAVTPSLRNLLNPMAHNLVGVDDKAAALRNLLYRAVNTVAQGQPVDGNWVAAIMTSLASNGIVDDLGSQDVKEAMAGIVKTLTLQHTQLNAGQANNMPVLAGPIAWDGTNTVDQAVLHNPGHNLNVPFNVAAPANVIQVERFAGNVRAPLSFQVTPSHEAAITYHLRSVVHRDTSLYNEAHFISYVDRGHPAAPEWHENDDVGPRNRPIDDLGQVITDPGLIEARKQRLRTRRVTTEEIEDEKGPYHAHLQPQQTDVLATARMYVYERDGIALAAAPHGAVRNISNDPTANILTFQRTYFEMLFDKRAKLDLVDQWELMQVLAGSEGYDREVQILRGDVVNALAARQLAAVKKTLLPEKAEKDEKDEKDEKHASAATGRSTRNKAPAYKTPTKTKGGKTAEKEKTFDAPELEHESLAKLSFADLEHNLLQAYGTMMRKPYAGSGHEARYVASAEHSRTLFAQLKRLFSERDVKKLAALDENDLLLLSSWESIPTIGSGRKQLVDALEKDELDFKQFLDHALDEPLTQLILEPHEIERLVAVHAQLSADAASSGGSSRTRSENPGIPDEGTTGYDKAFFLYPEETSESDPEDEAIDIDEQVKLGQEHPHFNVYLLAALANHILQGKEDHVAREHLSGLGPANTIAFVLHNGTLVPRSIGRLLEPKANKDARRLKPGRLGDAGEGYEKDSAHARLDDLAAGQERIYDEYGPHRLQKAFNDNDNSRRGMRHAIAGTMMWTEQSTLRSDEESPELEDERKARAGSVDSESEATVFVTRHKSKAAGSLDHAESQLVRTQLWRSLVRKVLATVAEASGKVDHRGSTIEIPLNRSNCEGCARRLILAAIELWAALAHQQGLGDWRAARDTYRDRVTLVVAFSGNYFDKDRQKFEEIAAALFDAGWTIRILARIKQTGAFASQTVATLHALKSVLDAQGAPERWRDQVKVGKRVREQIGKHPSLSDLFRDDKEGGGNSVAIKKRKRDEEEVEEQNADKREAEGDERKHDQGEKETTGGTRRRRATGPFGLDLVPFKKPRIGEAGDGR